MAKPDGLTLGMVQSSGDELEGLMKKVMDQPKDVIDRLKKMLEN